MSKENTLIIHPNQLFEKKYLDRDDNVKKIILYEHPDFFTKYKFNRLKLILHRASMKLYEKYLLKNGFDVKYKSFKDSTPIGETLFQPNEKNKKDKPNSHSPNFMCVELFEKYREKTDKFVFVNFYNWMKAELNILPNVSSKDKNNRQSMKSEPNIKQYNVKLSAEENKELISAINYVKLHFKNNPGPEWVTIYEIWNIPLTRSHAKSQLNYFIKNKIKNFGAFQDYMYFSENSSDEILLHSFLSSSLNIGILHPSDLLVILDLKIPMNSKEGFIRQLFWREYQLYCYRYANLNIKGNRYKGNKSLTKQWYDGTTKIYPIDFCIKKAFNTGYLHHIERLMVMGNFMLLYGIKPNVAFKWFMEFSIDSYEWVMYQNVLDMVFNVSGGKTMKRIYISSSNYILKMSNLKRDEWCDIWDDLYHKFVSKNKISYPYNST